MVGLLLTTKSLTVADCGPSSLQPQDAVEKAVITSEMIAAGGDDLDEVRQALTGWDGMVSCCGFSPLTEANDRSTFRIGIVASVCTPSSLILRL